MITGITSYLTVVNALILFFNLIPAFPLDGGRILRAILWKCKKDLQWATKITTRIGSAFALFLIFFGLFSFITGNFMGGIWLTILGLFLYRAAIASQTHYYMGKVLQDAKISTFMTKQVETVPPQISVKTLLDEHMYKSHHHLYPVVDQDRLVGYISLQEIKTVSQERWTVTSVQSIMVPLEKTPTVSSETHAMKALSIIQEMEVSTLFVVKDSHLEGLITAQDLFKLIYLKIELEGDEAAK
jgi:CBS domain-containing protein